MSCASSGHITKLKQSIFALRYLWCHVTQGGQGKYSSNCHVSLLLTVSLTNIANVHEPLEKKCFG